ncbi:MAG: hypothetical protein R3E01_27685 [Pirellulaceae bacterium]
MKTNPYEPSRHEPPSLPPRIPITWRLVLAIPLFVWGAMTTIDGLCGVAAFITDYVNDDLILWPVEPAISIGAIVGGGLFVFGAWQLVVGRWWLFGTAIVAELALRFLASHISNSVVGIGFGP